jgi:ABC-2 type transport system ATP-binding protein
MIEIQGFSKSYDGVKFACKDIDLTIEAGDLYGFIGHNGAGKTTLLKAIAGIHGFNSGTIRVCGKSIQDEPLEAKRQLAYIPDNPDIYESLKGSQYLDFIADVFGLSIDERTKRIERFATMFELEKALAQPISTYSHGMKQKLVLISALIHQPKVLLLDEPFVGLDPKASYLLKEVFQEMREQGTAIFFSTHVLDVAEKICNKVAIIKQGRIVASGVTADVVKDQTLESLFLELLAE